MLFSLEILVLSVYIDGLEYICFKWTDWLAIMRIYNFYSVILFVVWDDSENGDIWFLHSYRIEYCLRFN